MKGREQKDPAVPPTDVAATPFFARFLEDQYEGGGPEAKAAARLRSLKYPSDRDEDHVHSPAVEAAATNAGPSRMTLKYPSDRDEIDNYLPDYVEAAPSNTAPSRLTLKYPSDRDEIEPYLAPYGNAADTR